MLKEQSDNRLLREDDETRAVFSELGAVTVKQEGARVTAQVSGPLDIETAPEMEEKLLPLCESAEEMVVDLRSADYVDSTGVRAVLRLREALEARKGTLRLQVYPGSRAERTFTLLKLQDLLGLQP